MPNPMAMRFGRLYKGTPAELSLEDAVAELGIPYRTQFPGYLYGFRYFPDFLLPTIGAVIEVDDPSHNRTDKKLSDAERTDYFEHEQHWRVARVTNDEALDNPRGAVRAALASIGKWPLPSQRPRLRDALPQPRKCPQKITREAKSAARRASRTKRRGSSSRHSPEDQSRSLDTRPTPSSQAPTLPPTLVPLA